MKGANNSYFGSIAEAVKTSLTGVKITMRHLKDAVIVKRREATTASDENYFKQKEGIVTLAYPKEKIPVPDNGRYKLHNEIDDCIVCDKCAKICPVNCIDIEAVKSTETIGLTSDGTPKRLYAAKFDIDMAKCCFCGLCTTVCPTECLTMTKDYDFSVFDIDEMNFQFSDLSPEEAEAKKQQYEQAQEQKRKVAIAKNTGPTEKTGETIEVAGDKPDQGKTGKPNFRPKIKPKVSGDHKPTTGQEKNKGQEGPQAEGKKAIYRPKIKPVMKKPANKENEGDNSPVPPKNELSRPAKPVMKKPVIKPKTGTNAANTGTGEKPENGDGQSNDNPPSGNKLPKASNTAKKPMMRPKIKPKGGKDPSN